MNRFTAISSVLHIIVFALIIYSGQRAMKNIPRMEIYKVSIAPLPQPQVLSTENVVKETEVPLVTEQVTEEKTPPRKDVVKETPAEKKDEPKIEPKKETPKEPDRVAENVKKGLPDIKPKIYTGSGRGFTYSYYLNILLRKINQNWQNPFRGQDVILKSIIYFEVDKDGRVGNVRLEETSGNSIYNESAMRAVTLTKKLPPLPEEFSDDYLKVHLEFLTAQ